MKFIHKTNINAWYLAKQPTIARKKIKRKLRADLSSANGQTKLNCVHVIYHKNSIMEAWMLNRKRERQQQRLKMR